MERPAASVNKLLFVEQFLSHLQRCYGSDDGSDDGDDGDDDDDDDDVRQDIKMKLSGH